MQKKQDKQHPAIDDLKSSFIKGQLSRRDFLRYATLLGLSAAAAGRMIGFSQPRTALAATPRYGGVLKISSSVMKVSHPAQLSWIQPTNQLRQVAEYLTWTDANNLSHPYLLKNWEVSDDLKTWTLNLRQGVKFNNGDLFTADDVVFTISQWLNKDIGSSILGLMGDYMASTGIEKVNDHQVKLHLKRPEIAVPEHLFHYSAFILNHRTFEGDFIRAPHGTGPYLLKEYREGEICTVRRRNDYWQNNLPYMDGMQFVDMGDELAPQLAAIKSGDVDYIDASLGLPASAYKALKNDANVNVDITPTNWTRLIRMRVDTQPWNDNRVRTALKLCQHREKILNLAYMGQGMLGGDFHVSPKHPAYCEKEIPAYDPQKAKALLKEAGYANGIDVNLAVAADWTDVVRYAEVLKQDAAPAGFRINIRTMPASQYWEKWTEVEVGITPWAHRPLGTMVLNLAYTADEDGKPVPWNETRWVDAEFSALLKEANGILDRKERSKVMCKLEQIQMERGSIGLSYWVNYFFAMSKRFQNAKGHPSGYMMFNNSWLSES